MPRRGQLTRYLGRHGKFYLWLKIASASCLPLWIKMAFHGNFNNLVAMFSSLKIIEKSDFTVKRVQKQLGKIWKARTGALVWTFWPPKYHHKFVILVQHPCHLHITPSYLSFRIFGDGAVVATNTLWFNAHLGVGLYLYSRRHLQRQAMFPRVIYSVYGAVIYNFGMTLYWATTRLVLPNCKYVRCLFGVISGIAGLAIGKEYLKMLDTSIAEKWTMRFVGLCFSVLLYSAIDCGRLNFRTWMVVHCQAFESTTSSALKQMSIVHTI